MASISPFSIATKPFLSPSSSTTAAPRPRLLPRLLNFRHPPLNSVTHTPRRSHVTASPLLPGARGGRKVPSFSLGGSWCGRFRCWFMAGLADSCSRRCFFGWRRRGGAGGFSRRVLLLDFCHLPVRLLPFVFCFFCFFVFISLIHEIMICTWELVAWYWLYYMTLRLVFFFILNKWWILWRVYMYEGISFPAIGTAWTGILHWRLLVLVQSTM